MARTFQHRPGALARTAAAAAMITTLLSGCGSSATKPDGPIPGATRTIEIHDYAYHPRTITVRPGARIIFINRDATAHTATASTGGFDAGTIAPHQHKTLTLNKPGTYTYYCQFHAFMRGTLIVLSSR